MLEFLAKHFRHILKEVSYSQDWLQIVGRRTIRLGQVQHQT